VRDVRLLPQSEERQWYRNPAAEERREGERGRVETKITAWWSGGGKIKSEERVERGEGERAGERGEEGKGGWRSLQKREGATAGQASQVTTGGATDLVYLVVLYVASGKPC